MDPSTLLKSARAARKDGRPMDALTALEDALRRGPLDATASDKAGRLLQGLLTDECADRALGRVLILGQCTTSWVVTHLTAAAAGRGLRLAVREGEYDNVLQDLMQVEPGSVDTIVLLPWTQRLLGAGERSGAERVADELAFWQQAWGIARDRLGARLVQVGYDWVGTGPTGAHRSGREGAIAWVRRVNDALRERLPADAYFVDLEQVSAEVGHRDFYAPRRYFWTKQPFSEPGVQRLAEHIAAGVQALVTGPRKVLVLDLDNTLWGGVVGDEGPLGIALGETPDGEAFRAFQAYCKALLANGTLLAVCSKNNLTDAQEPFRVNPEMALRLDDFAAFAASWEPKAVAIERMAAELRLGLDSFVFFDDNPAEREQVTQALPGVAVVPVPEDASEYIRALERGLYFEAVRVTDADAQRAEQYRVERDRRQLESSATSIDDYLASLDMHAVIEPITDANLQRVVQLIGKTNQFNLTTRRHTQAQVEAMIAHPRSVAFALRSRDRFGDHGLIAVVIGVPEDERTLRVDTWLMSCRVIARTMEQATFAHLLEQARALGYDTLVGERIPTAKNALVAELFPSLGLRAAGVVGEVERYVAPVAQLTPPAHHVVLEPAES